ncbi:MULTISPECIES: hypothetical protein [unclassified Acinetobacter]|uniref:hypothetical protein n=1 Tax=unclassified Acinetobacter TaxID=196816 RepID=UPI0025BA8D2A|nr:MULTISPECIES: hypothetical protein [unclassified Acinetobacter]
MNFIFNQVKTLVSKKILDLESDRICVVLVNNYFTPDKDNKFLSEIPKINISSEPVELKKKSFENYVFDAEDIYFPCICGNDITGILIYQGCKNHHLIAFIDKAYSLPAIPNGGDIIVTWDNGTNKIFDMKEDFIDLK